MPFTSLLYKTLFITRRVLSLTFMPIHVNNRRSPHFRRSELARLLTSRPGTMVDHGGENGATPLHLAAAGGWEKCAANLLENQASPAIRNDKGQVL